MSSNFQLKNLNFTPARKIVMSANLCLKIASTSQSTDLQFYKRNRARKNSNVSHVRLKIASTTHVDRLTILQWKLHTACGIPLLIRPGLENSFNRESFYKLPGSSEGIRAPFPGCGILPRPLAGPPL